MEKNQFIRDLKEKDVVSGPFLIKFSALAVGKTGKPYMNLVLVDKTGEIDARIWDNVTQYAGQAVRDTFVRIDGRCQSYQGRRQVVIKELQILREDEINPEDFTIDSGLDAEMLYKTLCGFVESMKDPFYKNLALAILVEDSEVSEKLKRAPAARSLHHAYPSGLLEHVVSMTRILDFLANHYAPYIDRDLLFLGGFLHDVGKIWELSFERTTDYTTEGRLIGHLVMGVELIEKKIQLLDAQAGRLPAKFPEEKRLLIKHLILAHHGELEFGSPKRPKCLEALILHYVDDLDSKVNAIQRFVMQDQMVGDWTTLSRQFDRFFLKPAWAKEKGKDSTAGHETETAG